MTAKPGPRERLLVAARDLTYRHGVHVGVDAILEAAGVARRSLYQHFGGKDGLILEVLRTDESAAHYREIMDAAGDDPRVRLLAVFDELERITTQPGFRGCRYTSAELALSDPEHPAHGTIRGYKDELHAIFARELSALDHPDPDLGADQLLVLIDGVLAHAATRPDAHPALAAKSIASQLF